MSYQKSQAMPGEDYTPAIVTKNRRLPSPKAERPEIAPPATPIVEQIRSSASDRIQQIRSRVNSSGWRFTPRLAAHFVVIIFLLALFLTIFGVLMKQTDVPYSLHQFMLYPRLQTRDGQPLNYLPSKLYMKFGTEQQAWFELRSNLPFKSSSSFVMDFQTNVVAIADHALRNNTGSQKYCFVMPLDRAAFPNIETLKEAFEHTRDINETTMGWQPHWNVIPEEISTENAHKMLTRPMERCKDVLKWYKLVSTPIPQNEISKCYGCTDFCVPEFNLQREGPYDKQFYTLTVRRQNCFWLNVPEWRQWREPDYQQDAGYGNNQVLGGAGFWTQQPARNSWDVNLNYNQNRNNFPSYQPNSRFSNYQQPQYTPPAGRRRK